MRTPHTPTVSRFKQLSPSIYEAALHCKARAVWMVHGDRQSVPYHPKALLGICLHGVVEDAHNGKLNGLGGSGLLEAARALFDQRASALYERVHPLLRAKFSSPPKIPYYHLYRERAAAEAAVIGGRVSGSPQITSAGAAPSAPQQQVEEKLTSKDGLLVGRPDFIDRQAAEVVDYKTGAAPEEAPDGVSEAEARQLRLYVHLAHENGLAVSRAVVARADGRRALMNISNADASKEGQQAREVLMELNNAAGKTFEEVATPSVNACSQCSCIAFCEPFWRTAAADWMERIGLHLEGRVTTVEESTVQGIELVTVHLEVQRGTLSSSHASIEHIPKTWLTVDGSPVPHESEVVRIIFGRLTGAGEPAVIRVDRAATSIWTVAPAGR